MSEGQQIRSVTSTNEEENKKRKETKTSKQSEEEGESKIYSLIGKINKEKNVARQSEE